MFEILSAYSKIYFKKRSEKHSGSETNKTQDNSQQESVQTVLNASSMGDLTPR